MKYCWASTGAGSIRPLRGRSRTSPLRPRPPRRRSQAAAANAPSAGHCRSLQMRIALLSDVHGNLPAFEAVLGDVEEQAAEETWCLGDLVARRRAGRLRPARARPLRPLARGEPRPGRDRRDPDLDFSTSAAAARWTQETISDETMSYLKGSSRRTRSASPLSTTPARATRSGSTCSRRGRRTRLRPHGRPRRGRGPSHVALWFRRDDEGKVAGSTADAGTELDLSGGRWLLNPGGVQPRDGDPRRVAPARHLYVDGRMAPSGISDRRGSAGDRGRGAPARARRAPLQRAMSARVLAFLGALVLCVVGAGCGGDEEGKGCRPRRYSC